MSREDSEAAHTEELSRQQQLILLKVANKALDYGLEHHTKIPIKVSEFECRLQEPGASFVTLHLNGLLRGCIGTLEAYQPLVKDVSEHAYAAGFQDPRFPALTTKERNQLEISISVLSKASSIDCIDENDLVSKIHPGIDGLILEEGIHRGTFLPSVWESLSDPQEFLRQLKRKAGLMPDYWSDSLTVSRYTTQSFS